LQKNTFVDKIKNNFLVSDSQEVTVDVDDIMSMRLTFKIETKRDNNREDEILEGMKYIENGYADYRSLLS